MGLAITPEKEYLSLNVPEFTHSSKEKDTIHRNNWDKFGETSLVYWFFEKIIKFAFKIKK